ncbi:unnamed protein product [Caretta caretta]
MMTWLLAALLALAPCALSQVQLLASGPGVGQVSEPLTLTCAISGAQSQMQLVESGGAVRNEGESIRLSCKGSGFTFSSYDMFWYRQRPGESPEFVSRVNYDGSDRRYAAWAQGRFTVSRDNARSELYLGMSRLRRGDTARYHCAARETQ